MRHRRSHTKVVATLGPASANRPVLEKMFREGIDVCRLNFSHGSHEDHLKSIELINDLNTGFSSNVAILVDLQGPKLRIGDVENNAVELINGEEISFVNTPCSGNKERVYMSYEQLAQDVNTGEIILVDDGKIKLEVIETNNKDLVGLKIINAGIQSSKKGVNLQNTKVSLPSMTKKDIEDSIKRKEIEFHTFFLVLAHNAILLSQGFLNHILSDLQFLVNVLQSGHLFFFPLYKLNKLFHYQNLILEQV